jgi:UDP:flavonoid glycosyltransferase YjiC (YdhE family)
MVAAPEYHGHLFPALALARELHTRGHEVIVQSSERWRGLVEGMGMGFAVFEEDVLRVKPHRGPRRTLVEAARSLAPLIRELRPDVVACDFSALTPALAAELAGARTATLVPVPYPQTAPGVPLDELGLLPPRTPVGAFAWRALGPLLRARLPSRRWLRGGQPLDAIRAELGLAPLDRDDGAVASGPMLVSTLPQLEYPRAWRPDVHVTGPMIFDLPHPEIELPQGEDPLVLTVSSTSWDPKLRLVRTVLRALESESVRVVAARGWTPRPWSEKVPDNAVVTDWISYAQVMPRASLVIAQGGQGTLVRALAEGVPVLVCPETPDMGGNGTRVVWAGAGLMIPKRLLGVRPVRWSVRQLLEDPRFATRAGAMATWNRENDGAARGASVIEAHARR